MHNEFTAVFERDGEWFVAYCPEIPGANGQGRTKDEARQSLAQAIALILDDRREEGCVASRPTLKERPWFSNEAEQPAAASRRHGCILKREGAAHSLWTNPTTGAVEAIPRHTEISNNLARKICRGLSVPETGQG